jgi:opacity protein-like surface antigen
MSRIPGLAIVALLGTAVPAMAQQGVQYSTPAGTWSFGQFYMRGDAGGAFSAGSSLKSTEPYASDSLLGPGAELQGNTGNSDIFDIGLGARLLPYLRWDATLSYLPSMKFSGSGNAAHMNSWVGMVNGYIDLKGLMPAAFGPFQPYVDAGIGAASNTMDALSTTLGGGTTISGNTRTSLAYGVGAGVGYPVAPNMTLDVAYRYLGLGEAETGSSDTAGPVAPLKTDLRENTVTMGLRYMF